jgi:hypothetical protein
MNITILLPKLSRLYRSNLEAWDKTRTVEPLWQSVHSRIPQQTEANRSKQREHKEIWRQKGKNVDGP